MDDAKAEQRPLFPEDAQLALEVERKSSIRSAEPSESGQEASVTVENLPNSALLTEQTKLRDAVESVPLLNMDALNLSGMKISEVVQSSSPVSDSTKTNSPNASLPTQVSATTGGPSRDPRYSQEETGSIMIHIYKDRSVTVDFNGIVDVNIIRGRAMHALLMAYQQYYRPALRRAVDEKRLAAEAAQATIRS